MALALLHAVLVLGGLQGALGSSPYSDQTLRARGDKTPICCGKIEGDYTPDQDNMNKWRDTMCHYRDQPPVKPFKGDDSTKGLNQKSPSQMVTNGYYIIQADNPWDDKLRTEWFMYAADSENTYSDCEEAFSLIFNECILKKYQSGSLSITEDVKTPVTHTKGQMYGFFLPRDEGKEYKINYDKEISQKDAEEVKKKAASKRDFNANDFLHGLFGNETGIQAERVDSDVDADENISDFPFEMLQKHNAQDWHLPSGPYRINGEVWDIDFEGDMFNKHSRKRDTMDFFPFVQRRDGGLGKRDYAPLMTSRNASTSTWKGDNVEHEAFASDFANSLLSAVGQRPVHRRRTVAEDNHVEAHQALVRRAEDKVITDMFKGECTWIHTTGLKNEADHYILTASGTWETEPLDKQAFVGKNVQVSLDTTVETETTYSLGVSVGVQASIFSASMSFEKTWRNRYQRDTSVSCSWDHGYCHMFLGRTKMGWQRGLLMRSFDIRGGTGRRYKRRRRSVEVKVVHTDAPLDDQGKNWDCYTGCCTHWNESPPQPFCSNEEVTPENREYYGVCNKFTMDPSAVTDIRECTEWGSEEEMKSSRSAAQSSTRSAVGAFLTAMSNIDTAIKSANDTQPPANPTATNTATISTETTSDATDTSETTTDDTTATDESDDEPETTPDDEGTTLSDAKEEPADEETEVDASSEEESDDLERRNYEDDDDDEDEDDDDDDDDDDEHYRTEL